jgi:hypothetical protein
MKQHVAMRAALDDPALLGSILPGPSWAAWRVLLIASMGEPLLTDEERATFAHLTGRPAEPLQRVEEFWGVIGRRGGKTRGAATLACYLAALVDHSANLAIGERGLVLFIAENTKQAAVAFGYACGIFDAVPLLRELVVNRTADTISLSNGIDLEVRAASFRGLRGPTCVAVIADEAGYWAVDDAVNADAAILAAVRPALSTTQGPLIVISSPYARRGEVWNTHRLHFGEKGDPRILVACAASRELNPSLPQSVIDRAYARDPVAAASEYGAQFRSDLEAFVSREAIEACVASGVFERAPIAGLAYHAFVDPSGGSADAMTLAVAHQEGERAVLDAVRERRPPFSPEAVVAEFSALLKTYGLAVVRGDRYAGEWPREQFRKHGNEYYVSSRDRSAIYTDLLPIINSGRADLLDNPRLISQFVSLERRTGRGRDTIDHPPGAHDDIANSCAGALLAAIDQATHAPQIVAPILFTAGPSVFRSGGAAPITGGTARNPAHGLPHDGRDSWGESF